MPALQLMLMRLRPTAVDKQKRDHQRGERTSFITSRFGDRWQLAQAGDNGGWGMTERKPGVAFLVTVVVLAAVPLYPLSFGPSVWLASRGHVDGNVIERAFRPILWAAVRG